MNLLGKTSIHPILFYSGKTLGYLTWIVQILLILNIRIVEPHPFSNKVLIASIMFAFALVFIVLSLKDLGRSTRIGLPSEDTVLKTDGIYRLSRNPMYLGVHLWTISAMIYTMNLWIIIFGIYSILIYHWIILSEERFLEKRFGKKYSDYKKKTRRYL